MCLLSQPVDSTLSIVLKDLIVNITMFLNIKLTTALHSQTAGSNVGY